MPHGEWSMPTMDDHNFDRVALGGKWKVVMATQDDKTLCSIEFEVQEAPDCPMW